MTTEAEALLTAPNQKRLNRIIARCGQQVALGLMSHGLALHCIGKEKARLQQKQRIGLRYGSEP